MTKETMKVHYSSERHDWGTPPDLFDALSHWFGRFHLDTAANTGNTMCEKYLGPGSPIAEDALKIDWVKTVIDDTLPYMPCFWCNPPYGRTLNKWFAKFTETSKNDGWVVALVPARPDTRYWHEHVWLRSNVDVFFIKGRLKFRSQQTKETQRLSPAPFPSAIIVFRPHLYLFSIGDRGHSIQNVGVIQKIDGEYKLMYRDCAHVVIKD